MHTAIWVTVSKFACMCKVCVTLCLLQNFSPITYLSKGIRWLLCECKLVTILNDWRITSSAENNYLGGRDEHVYGRETRKLVLLKRWKRMNLSYGDRKSINIPLDRNERIKFTVDWEFKIKIPCRGRKCVERVCFSAHVYKKNCELHLHEYNRNFW